MATIAPAPAGANTHEPDPAVPQLAAVPDPLPPADATAPKRHAKPAPSSRKSRPLGPAEYLPESYIRQLIAACPKRSATGLRNRAIILTLWRTGLRASELVGLTVADASSSRPNRCS